MINLEEIKTPSSDDIHKLAKLKVVPSIRSRDGIMRGKSTVVDNEWYDQFGIWYNFKNGKLFISHPKELETLLQHIDRIKSNINIVIMVDNANTFNDLCRKLQERPTNKNIDIAISSCCYFNKRRKLDFELLPDNVKVSNLYCDYKEQLPICNDFDWWGLWLNDRDFECVRRHLTPLATERFEKLHFIAQSFYENFSRNRNSLTSDRDKVDFVFRWMRKNIPYADEAVNPDGTLKREKIGYISQDPVCTFERKRGVCAGRARLMKVLLNNRFMRVNCFITFGRHNNLSHEWNEVYFADSTRSYYDLSFGVYDEKTLSWPYHRLDHSDAERGYITEDTPALNNCPPLPPRREASPILPPPLPSRREASPILPPPLPPRKSSENEVAVQKRKLPPQLPRRHNASI